MEGVREKFDEGHLSAALFPRESEVLEYVCVHDLEDFFYLTLEVARENSTLVQYRLDLKSQRKKWPRHWEESVKVGLLQDFFRLIKFETL